MAPPIDLFGMWHTLSAHPDVFPLLAKSLAQCPLLLTEENLGTANSGLHSNGFDLPDHHTRGLLAAFLHSEIHQLKTISFWIKSFLPKPRHTGPIRNIGTADTLNATTPDGEGFEKNKRRFGLRSNLIRQMSRLSLFVPVDIHSDLPTQVELAYQHEKGIPYSLYQARSAYMAEFVRTWDIKATVEKTWPEAGEGARAVLTARKQLLCGQQHAEEIAYFLRYGSKEDGVIAGARRDAEILSHRGASEAQAVFRRRAMACKAVSTASVILKGVVGGLVMAKLLTSIF